MRVCCPPGHGCNAAGGAEACALELCRTAAAEQKDAALALKRWNAFELARTRGRSERECRFRRRAFERARDRALIALAMQPAGAESARRGWRDRRRLAHGGRGRGRALAG